MAQNSPECASSHSHEPLAAATPPPLQVTASLCWHLRPAHPSAHTAHRPYRPHAGSQPSSQMQLPL